MKNIRYFNIYDKLKEVNFEKESRDMTITLGEFYIKKYKALINNDDQLQHMQVLANGSLSKTYSDSKLTNLTNKQLEQETQALQEYFIRGFCNDLNYNFFNNNEILGCRIA